MQCTIPEEMIKIVDKDNNVIGKATRKQMRSMNLFHRNAHIFLYNLHHSFYIQKRSALKDYCPGWFSLAVGGVIEYDEDEMSGALRELKEEMGVEMKNIKFHGILPFESRIGDDNNRGFSYIYSGQYDGPIVKQDEEVAEVLLWSADEIEEKMKIAIFANIVPDSIEAYKKIAITKI